MACIEPASLIREPKAKGSSSFMDPEVGVGEELSVKRPGPESEWGRGLQAFSILFSYAGLSRGITREPWPRASETETRKEESARSVNISQVWALRETAVPSCQQSGVEEGSSPREAGQKSHTGFQPRVGLFTSLWRGLFSHHLSIHWLVPSLSSIPSRVNSSPCQKFWGVLVKCQYTSFYPFSGSEEQGDLLGNPGQDEGSSSFRQCPRSTFSDPRCWHSELSPSFPTLPAQLSSKHPRHHHPGMASLSSCSCCKPVDSEQKSGAGRVSVEACFQECRTSDQPELCTLNCFVCVIKYI